MYIDLKITKDKEVRQYTQTISDDNPMSLNGLFNCLTKIIDLILFG
jgi:hypothetical protein